MTTISRSDLRNIEDYLQSVYGDEINLEVEHANSKSTDTIKIIITSGYIDFSSAWGPQDHGPQYPNGVVTFSGTKELDDETDAEFFYLIADLEVDLEGFIKDTGLNLDLDYYFQIGRQNWPYHQAIDAEDETSIDEDFVKLVETTLNEQEIGERNERLFEFKCELGPKVNSLKVTIVRGTVDFFSKELHGQYLHAMIDSMQSGLWTLLRSSSDVSNKFNNVYRNLFEDIENTVFSFASHSSSFEFELHLGSKDQPYEYVLDLEETPIKDYVSFEHSAAIKSELDRMLGSNIKFLFSYSQNWDELHVTIYETIYDFTGLIDAGAETVEVKNGFSKINVIPDELDKDYIHYDLFQQINKIISDTTTARFKYDITVDSTIDCGQYSIDEKLKSAKPIKTEMKLPERDKEFLRRFSPGTPVINNTGMIGHVLRYSIDHLTGYVRIVVHYADGEIVNESYHVLKLL